MNLIDDLIFYKDKDFIYIGCNDAFLEFINKTQSEILGCNDFELFDHELATLFRYNDELMLKENTIRTNEEWVTYPDGEEVYLLTKKIPFVYDGINTGILGISRNITELERSKQQLTQQTLLDELTQLENRKAYNTKIQQLLALFNRYNTIFSMIIIDIDDFKKINDKFGHSIGDDVLKSLSAKLKSQLRRCDYLYRIGGEEFIILLESTPKDNAQLLAEKLRSSVEANPLVNQVQLTISVGVCEVIDIDNQDSLFQRADSLLYQSKFNGKNKVSS